MARARKRTVQEMRAELDRLQEEIQSQERGEQLAQIIDSKEFKYLARQIKRLDLSAQELGELFAKGAKPKRARKTTKRKARTKVEPKYRHPENTQLTWSGRGKHPNWIKEALESGLTLADMLIEKEGSPEEED
jgi:DNA-binding protein H-NS